MADRPLMLAGSGLLNRESTFCILEDGNGFSTPTWCMMKRSIRLCSLLVLTFLAVPFLLKAQNAGCDLVLVYTGDDSVRIEAQFYTPAGVTFRMQAIYVTVTYDSTVFSAFNRTIMNHRFAASNFTSDSDPFLNVTDNPRWAGYGEYDASFNGINFPANLRRTLCTFTFRPKAPGPGNTSFYIYGNVVAPAFSGYWITTSFDNQPFTPANELINVDWPVEFVSFSAVQQGRAVSLKWVTASETGNYGFFVERRLAGNDEWSTVDFVPGRGNSRTDQQYLFVDKSLARDGRYEYRLRQQDVDGSVMYSTVAAVNYRTDESSFSLEQNYPNPLSGMQGATVLRYSLAERSRVSLVVTNTLGQVVAQLADYTQSAGTWSSQWTPAGLPSGTYVATLTAVSEASGAVSRAAVTMAVTR